MSRQVSRRKFIITSATGGVGLAMGNITRLAAAAASPFSTNDDLYKLSTSLSATWATTLLGLQIKDKSQGADYGGLRCPGTQKIYGRIGDTIYPFMHMARRTGDHRYLDAATLLFRWIETNVSQPDGSWTNEINDKWKGITAFTVIALSDAIRFHGDLMDPAFKSAINDRLTKAGEFIYSNFNIDFGNINYPISGAYALSLLGTIQEDSKFKEKGRELTRQAMKFFTQKDHLLFGEGTPYYEASKKGCFSVDLGYNVEESLPNLVLNGLLNKNEELLGMVTASLQSHMEFMLPDGGWDNSWGTRNYKWTYWGSRTSDGCQPAYALLADRDPRFYRVALKNTQLLQQCTVNGLLMGGPHFNTHQVPVSMHHTFCHIKALTTMLDHERPTVMGGSNTLPRENAYGLRNLEDVQTWLVATGKFRATVTGYDREYKAMHNGHATGGALTMLWHEHTGPLLAASMNNYQLVESGNMQSDTDPHSMALTPRIELTSNGVTYMNISYLESRDAGGGYIKDKDEMVIMAHSRLVDQDQKDPAEGPVECYTKYTFTPNKITLALRCLKVPDVYKDKVRIVVPVVSASTETVQTTGNNKITIQKKKARVTISSNKPLTRLETTDDRIFNFVPGLEAIPLAINEPDATIEISVHG